MNRIRQDKIKEYIEEKNVVSIKELQELFPEVSLMTIHRDLDVLEDTGAIVKFRGGARSVRYAGDPEFNVRMRDNNSGKLLIARKAMELIQPHSSIFLDASTTNLALARILPDMNLNIFTTGPSIALELCRLHNPVVTLCCGTINRKTWQFPDKTPWKCWIRSTLIWPSSACPAALWMQALPAVPRVICWSSAW